MHNIVVHLKTLIELAIVDGQFDETEQAMILSVGKAHAIPEEEIETLIEEGIRSTRSESLNFSALSFDQKFEYLYNIIQLMKIDREIYLSEIRYCESIAEKLGFEKRIVNRMSMKIYGDPTITSDRERLKEEVKKFIT